MLLITSGKPGHDRLLPHPFKFIIHYHPIIRRYTVRVTDIVVKYTTNKPKIWREHSIVVLIMLLVSLLPVKAPKRKCERIVKSHRKMGYSTARRPPQTDQHVTPKRQWLLSDYTLQKTVSSKSSPTKPQTSHMECLFRSTISNELHFVPVKQYPHTF
jgi:hypothetical protein